MNDLTMRIVGRSERSDLRLGNPYEMGHVGGRSARSDLQHYNTNEKISIG